MGMLFWKNTKNLGSRGESLAVKYLKSNGYKILEKNFKNNRGKQMGEIDIIAKKNNEIIFVEVKTRELKECENVLPEENITSLKLKKLEKIANFYLKINDLWDSPYRFDAISVWLNESQKEAKIKHIESIFI